MKKVKVGKSKIHGNGLFADEPIKRGDVIQLVHTMRELEPGVMKTTPTLLGRNYNHSEDSNALNVVDGNNRYLVALKEIEVGGEITTDYRSNPELEQPGSFASNDNYVSFDYDDTLTTPEGFKLAQQMNKEGKNLYVITARDKVTPQMIERAEAAGIPKENIITAGSDEAKVKIVKENNISKHIDNKESVIKALGDTGELFTPNAYSDLKADFIEMDLTTDDLNKLKEGGFIVEESPDKGIITQEEIDAANNAMMKARLAYAYMHGNPAAQRMVVAPDQPYDFGDGMTGTHYMASMDNYAVPQIQDVNGQLMLGDYGPESAEAIRFDTDQDANYFAENYKQVTPDPSYRQEEYAKGGDPGKGKKGKSKNVQPFVTSDPKEYAYRKAAYDDSLHTYQMAPNLKRKENYIDAHSSSMKDNRQQLFNLWKQYEDKGFNFDLGYNQRTSLKRKVSDGIIGHQVYDYKKPIQPVQFKKPKLTQGATKKIQPIVEQEVIEPTLVPQPVPTPVVVNPELQKFVEKREPGTGADVMPVYDTDELPMYATPDGGAEWIGDTERYVDWDGNRIPYRLPRFRKPGHGGDLIRRGKQRYIPFPSIESRYQAEIVPEEEYQDGGEQKIPWNPDYPVSTTYQFQPLSPEQIAQRNLEQEKERAMREQERLMQEQENWTPAQWAQYRKQEDLKKYQQALIDEPKYFNEGRQFVNDWHNSPMYNKMVLNSYNGNAKDAAYITKLRQQNIASMPKLNIVNSRTTKYNSEAPAAWADHTQVEVFPGGFGTGPSLYVHEGLHVSDTPKLNFQPKSYSDPRFPKDDAVWLGRLMPASDQMYMLKNRAANYKDNSAYDEMLADSGYKIPTDEEIKQEVISEGISSDNPNFDEYFNKVKNQYVDSFKVFDQQNKRVWQEHSHNYVSNPTEVRARLGEIRYNAKNAGIYDPFTEELTPEKFQEYINKKENRGGAFGDLREQYTDEEILWMLNNISKNEGTDQKLDVAKKGGEPKKKKRKTDDYGRYRSEDGNVRTPITPEMQAVMPPDEWGQYIQEFPEVYTTRTKEQQEAMNAAKQMEFLSRLRPKGPSYLYLPDGSLRPQAAQSADWVWQLGMTGPAALKGINAAMKIPLGAGVNVGGALNAGMITHGATQVDDRYQDWQDVAKGEMDWKEAALKTGMTALELSPAYGAAKELLPQTYKINPWAFKPDPSKFYRQIGNAGLEDALSSKVIRSADQSTFPRPYFVEGKDFKMLEQTGTGAHGRPTSIFETSGVTDDGLPFVSPANASADYTPWIADMAEVPLTEGRLLKQNWLRGYKEVPKELPGSPNSNLELGKASRTIYPEPIVNSMGLKEYGKTIDAGPVWGPVAPAGAIKYNNAKYYDPALLPEELQPYMLSEAESMLRYPRAYMDKDQLIGYSFKSGRKKPEYPTVIPANFNTQEDILARILGKPLPSRSLPKVYYDLNGNIIQGPKRFGGSTSKLNKFIR